MNRVFGPEGEIREVDPLAALVACWRESSSGALRFTRGATQCGLDIEGGEVVAVVSSDPRFETHAILVRAGKLSQEAIDRLAPQGGDLALAALQAGILTRREWKWGEKIRAIEVLSDLLAWSDGSYRWDVSARPRAGDFRLVIPRLLLELFLRSRDRHLIDHQLGPPELALERAESFDREFPTFGLTADAESVVRLIDGKATAEEIAAKAPAEDFAVRKLLAALVTLGLVRSIALATARKPEERTEPAPGFPPLEPEPPTEGEATPPEFAISIAVNREEPPEIEPWAGERRPEATPREEPLRVPPAIEPPLDRFEPHLSRAERGLEPAPRRESADVWDAEPAPDLPPPEEGPAEEPDAAGRGRTRVVLAWTLGILIAAVAGVVLLKSRVTPPGPAPGAEPTAASAVSFPPPMTAAGVVVSPARRETVPAAAPTAAAIAVAERAARPSPASPRAGKPTPAGRRAPAPASSGSREAWVRRGERDRRRLETDRQTRYAIQLELVCETVSLVEAWRHDRKGEMWLLPVSHLGRDCFRVFWGRYRSLEAARRAKVAIPAYFVTSRNRPAVVAVR